MSSKRSRNGCWTCRKRHQKCDETKPACWNCQLRGVECGGYSIKLTNRTVLKGKDGHMVFKISRESPAARSTPRQPGPARLAVAELQRKGRNTIQSEDEEVVTSLPHSDSQTSGGVSFVNEADRVAAEQHLPANYEFSMDDTRPTEPSIGATSESSDHRSEDCLPFVLGAHNLMPLHAPGTGEGHDPTVQVSHQNVEAANDNAQSHSNDRQLYNSSGSPPQGLLDFTLLNYLTEIPANSTIAFTSPLSGWVEDEDSEQAANEEILEFMKEPILHPAPSDPFDQYLFGHYINNLSLRLYPIQPDRNPYRQVYGHLATRFEPLRNAILFASALHLSKIGQLPKFAISPYRTAMRDSFRDAIQSEDAALGLAATVLLSVVFDVVGTGLDIWSSKLLGCRRLLQLGLKKLEDDPDTSLSCILVQYNWAAMMGQVLKRGMLPSSTVYEMKYISRWSADGHDIHNRKLAQSQSHWFGNLPDYRMHLFLREATELCSTVDKLKEGNQPSNTVNLLQLMPSIADLVSRIQLWSPDVSSIDPEFTDSVKHFNEVWRQGMLCYVYHDIYCLPLDHMLLQTCVHTAIGPLSKLSWLQACLFPVFLVAVHARTEEARNVFELRLTDMHTSLAFQAPLSIVLVLKTIWEQLDADQSGTLRWRDIIKNMELELNVLL